MNIRRCGTWMLGALLGAGGAFGALPPEWDEAAPPPAISGPLFRVFENGKWGYIDKSGRLAVRADFDTATDFYEGRAGVSVNREFFILKDDGRLIRSQDLRAPFREGRAFAANFGQPISILDPEGKVVLGGIRDFEPYSDGWALVVTNADWVYVDRDGRVVMDPTNTVHNAPEQRSCNAGADEAPTQAHPFANGRSRIFMAHSKWAFLDKTGKVAIPARFERAHDFAEGLARVRLEGKWGFIKPDGAFAVEAIFEDARDFSDGLAAVKLGGKWGYVDTAGKQVIAPQFEEPERFQEGLALLRRQGKVGFMDKQGRAVIAPAFDGAREFKDGLAMVWAGTRRGYINPKGEWVYVRDTLFTR